MKMPQFDGISIKRAETAHPKIRKELKQIYFEANNNLGRSRLRFTHVLRTFKEQNRLYQQGRTLPGSIVTNARGGQSTHNFGLGVDIVLLIDKDGNGSLESASWDILKDYDRDGTADWLEVVRVFKKYGWTWGGDWRNFKDYSHFQKTFGKSTKELLYLYQRGLTDKSGYVLL